VLAHFRIKICGVTKPADALAAVQLGADAIGLNFYERSTRFVEPAAAARITCELPSSIEAVAVYVNQRLKQMKDLAERVGGIRSLQPHGEAAELGNAEPFRLTPAFPVTDRDSLQAIHAWLARCRSEGWMPAAVLVDAYVPGQHGGTGLTAPWKLLADFRTCVPMILAGGLTPDNVAEAIHVVQPDGVDVASGVESHAGCKDADKMRRFIDNARMASAKLHRRH
jgi:phosphoribosylanthranilate isomerase